MNKDENLSKIKSLVKFVLPGSRVILFGSRGRGNFDNSSDYDVLVVSNKKLDVKTKRRYAGKIRKELAVMGIPGDVLVKTETDVSYYRDKIGSLVREAVRDGITL
ncbi:MAG: nucleotidyltransferase domain-containing protein [bacterium]|nr:nucleotidyltransferase domain-containing protein [bacterium]